jgi:hypothetical protein
MNSLQQASRNWHPIETAIIQHVERYGITTPEAAQAAEVKGMTTVPIARQRLSALVKRGELASRPLAANSTCYLLSPAARKRLGHPVTERSGRPLSPRAIAERFAFLAFCCLREKPRTKLTAAEIKTRFTDLYRPGADSHYYVATEDDHPRLGFLRVDFGNHGRWDRIVAKVSDDLRKLFSIPLIRALLEQQAFEVTIVTSLPAKARRVEAAMADRRDVFPVPVFGVPVPELINLIRPAPD